MSAITICWYNRKDAADTLSRAARNPERNNGSSRFKQPGIPAQTARCFSVRPTDKDRQPKTTKP